MFKKSLIILLFSVIFSFNVYAQQQQKEEDKCNTYAEPSLGVTFCAPPRWTIVKQKDELYAVIFGEKGKAFAPNINMQAGPFKATLFETTNSGVEAVLATKGKNGISKVEVKSKTVFGDKAQIFKVVYDVEAGGLKIMSIQYFFKGAGDTKIVITATLPLSEADVLEGIVDSAIKTLKVSS